MRKTLNIPTPERRSRSQTGWALRARLLTAVLGLCLFCIGMGTTFDAPLLASSPSTLSLSMHNQYFSAHILRVPLEHVLAKLTSYGHFRFMIEGNAKDDLISSSFRHLSLQESLETLLLGYDYAIIQHRLDPTPQTSKLRYLMEVVVLAKNPAEPSSGEQRPSLISSKKTSTQPVLLRANQIYEKPKQAKPSDFGTENGESDFQSTLDEALQDSDPEARSLIEELLQE
jgi:hypothetical protein